MHSGNPNRKKTSEGGRRWHTTITMMATCTSLNSADLQSVHIKSLFRPVAKGSGGSDDLPPVTERSTYL